MELGGAGGWGPQDAWLGRHQTPVIDSCSSGSLHLVGKWDRLKRKQGEVLRTLVGLAALLCAQAPPLQA